jgi:integrase
MAMDRNKMVLADVRKPSSAGARDRRVSDHEIEQLIPSSRTELTKAEARAVHAFRFAIETAMRAGEITGLTRFAVDIERKTAHLPNTKNGTACDVPLSSAAIALINELPGKTEKLFGLDARSLDTLFRRVRDRTEIDNLRFHDSRHEAITRLAQKLEPLELARAVGHKNLIMLLIYYNQTAEQLAQKLG